MKRIPILFFAAVILFSLSSCFPKEGTATPEPEVAPTAEPQNMPTPTIPVETQEPLPEKTLEERIDEAKTASVEFMELLASGNGESAWELASDTLKGAITVDALLVAWESTIIEEIGEYKGVAEVSVEHEETQGYVVAVLKSIHENESTISIANLTFDKYGKLAGIYFNFAPNEFAEETTESEFFTEELVIVGESTNYPLEGLLTVPKNIEGTVPAVVLVHGSGALDRNEMIYANKPFQDIAHYLSERGIAVIRYDKRTFTHSEQLLAEFGANLTVYEETIEDAVLAKQLLEADERIDNERIYVLGHSLGGMLAPEIASVGNFSGCIIMAGTNRSLPEIMLEQYFHIFSVSELTEEEIEAQLAPIREQVELYRSTLGMTDDEIKETNILGVSAYYFRNLDERIQLDYLNNLEIPVLALQGDKDYQCTVEKDFIYYQQKAEEKDNVTAILYDGLYHLFMPSLSTDGWQLGTPADYEVPSHVDERVLQDIVSFIMSSQVPPAF